MMKFLIFSTLFSITLGQQLMSLSSFKGGNERNDLKVDAPFGIYVSATSDSAAVLANIYVVLEDGNKTSLNQLRNNKLLQNSGELQPLVVPASAYLTTSSSTTALKALNGVMFLCSAAQLRDEKFHVIDVSMSQTINLQTTTGDGTYFFLNTHMGTNPYRSSIISQWKQGGYSRAFLYAGFPLGGTQVKNTQIFSNPMVSDKFDNALFSNVEKFSLTNTVAFYLKVSNGGPSFRIEPGYSNVDGTTTTSTTTTGFYMKNVNGADNTVTIHTKRDNKYTGSCGANTHGHLPGGKVSVSVNDGASQYDDNSAVNSFFTPWSVPYVGENFQISSSGGVDGGVYYVQYFTLQGPAKSGSTILPGRQTTAGPGGPTIPGHVETTTKSSGQTSIPPAPTLPGHVETTTKSSAIIKLSLFAIVLIGVFGV
ncbi:hypothetical protein GCK72_019098 [Caenorhabditis remanei]|uniref:CUB-like domain-containing protein n=1 Tax=Caenorhabditis remanei TaxID=31234 RepID=A0A6A5GCZ2_CAERE|nr:hypothetical protein GCK72_019098 [Caenorhabditis remanei]KAF1752543.1 hypothetical protein GCK72_019098 [Caenorhabditis remanei]